MYIYIYVCVCVYVLVCKFIISLYILSAENRSIEAGTLVSCLELSFLGSGLENVV
jgi:hypothetical protein